MISGRKEEEQWAGSKELKRGKGETARKRKAAKQYHTDWRAVEHCIRVTILRSWTSDPTRFEKILGMWKKEKPSAGKFLAALYAYLLIEFEEEAI